MADAVDVIFNTIMTIWDVFKWTWWLLLVGLIVVLKIRWKNWPLEAVIVEKRGNNLIKTNDRMGKFQDPYSKLVMYKLLKAKDHIPVVNFDWIMVNVFKSTNIFEKFINLLRGDVGTVFLFKYGTKQYKPIHITQNGKSKLTYQEVKDEKGNPIVIQTYQQYDPRKYVGNLEFDVIDWDDMNTMVQEQRVSVMRNRKQGDFLKQVVVPILIIGATVIFSLIMIKYAFDYASMIKGSQTAFQEQPKQPATVPDIPIIGDILPGQ